ncbi:hypothetical protein HMP09_0118 [Sphingomonas sp. HMP9]|uniref:Flp family type IVb pilin n=1 Tax=Sphingomonas sp. HMP9 TaxID=1517554 RepID=UPI0015969FC3|nr:Flp family type IVb pilin [Sphingomonas sp. HMP9]BCA60884.1 hypothetical protein HMP09_0118 [Sphingomonas sp. HMP9]
MDFISPATTPVIRTIARAVRDRKGATAVEYGMIVAFVVIAMIVGLATLGRATTGLWTSIETKVTAAR